MVLLETAAIFGALSIVIFIAGLALDRPELAMFGAVVMIGVGGTGVVQGYQVTTGEVKSSTNVISATEDISTITHIHSKDVSAQDADPTGVEFKPDGSVMYIAGDQNDAIYSYDSGVYDLSTTTYRRMFSVAAEDATPVGVEFDTSGTVMYVTGDATDSIYQYTLSEAWNVSTANLTGSLDVSAQTTEPRAIDFSSNGNKLFVVGADTGEIHEYDLNTSWDVQTAVHDESLDVSSQTTSPTGIDFSLDGTQMLLIGEDTDALYQYEVATPHDIGTAAYSGESFDFGGYDNRPSAIAYEDDGKQVFVSGRLGSEVHEFDSSVTETVEETNKTYDDVTAISSFPLEIVVLLLGAVMLFTGSGQASETGREQPPWRRRD